MEKFTNLTRIALFGLMASAVVASAVAQPAAAVSKETPEAFVRRVYALYKTHDSQGVSMQRPAGAAFYAEPLLDAFAKDAELAHGEVGAIDADPICACQDWDKLRVKSVALTKGEAGTVKARVAIRNLDSNYTVILTLSPTPAGWRIADVGDKDRPSTMAVIQDEIAHPPKDMPSDTKPSPSKP